MMFRGKRELLQTKLLNCYPGSQKPGRLLLHALKLKHRHRTRRQCAGAVLNVDMMVFGAVEVLDQHCSLGR